MDQQSLSSAPQKVVISNESEEICTKIVINEKTDSESVLSGTVTDKATTKTIDNVCIHITDSEYNPVTHTFSDIDGHFSLRGKLPSCIRILAAKKGYVTYTSDVVTCMCVEKKGITIALSPAPNNGVVLFGCTKDTNQKPAEGVKITLYRNGSLSPYDVSTTNSEGMFVFDNIEPGGYRMIYQSLLFNECTRNIEISREQPIVVLETSYMRRKPVKGTVNGIITDANGLAVGNALVILCNANHTPLQVTRTNERGVYIFSKLDTGTYYIIAK